MMITAQLAQQKALAAGTKHPVPLLQVPVDERPAYVKGQHLRGVDNDNAERCRAEIVSAFA